MRRLECKAGNTHHVPDALLLNPVDPPPEAHDKDAMKCVYSMSVYLLKRRLSHKELQSPGEVTKAFLEAVDADLYGKVMKMYLTSKEHLEDPKI